MSKAKQQQRKQIKADIGMGRIQYIIQRGVIGWGFPTLLLYLGLTLVIQRLFGTPFAQSFRDLFPFTILFAMAIFAAAGVYMGNFRWKQLLKKVSEGKKKNQPAKEEKKT